MAIMNTTKSITIQTMNGQVYVSPDFNLERDTPCKGMTKITDKEDNKVYWFNTDNLVWVGPRV